VTLQERLDDITAKMQTLINASNELQAQHARTNEQFCALKGQEQLLVDMISATHSVGEVLPPADAPTE